MDWTYLGVPFTEVPEGIAAFVYLITDTVSGKQYVGKKRFFFKRKKVSTKKGKKRSKRVVLDSDWRDYFGSSEELQNVVEQRGAENFRREILHLCPTLGWASYLELREQMDRRVMEFPEKFYNTWVSGRVRRSHIPLEKKPSTAHD